MNLAIDAVVLLLCYLMGAIPTGLIVARQVGGIDIRRHGSRNIGATNVWRVLGKKAGLATFAIDVAKGFLAVMAAASLSAAALPALPILGGLAALLGNFFNVFLGFKGGKGVATSLGVFLALIPVAMVVAFGVFVIVVWATRYISLGSIIAAILLPILVLIIEGAGILFWVILAVCLLVLYKHRENFRRLMSGTENRFDFGSGRKQPG